MVVLRFPPVETADEHGLLAVGGDLTVESLMLSYRSGIFPWPLHQDLLTWFAPPKRAILFFDELHISKSLEKEIKKDKFEVRVDTNFEAVIRECAKTKFRKDQQGTWITEEMIQSYIELHQAGYAHSFETYEEGSLVGGHYGVSIGGMYAGESMFYRVSNASKVSLVAAVEHLKARGVKWLDCQVITPLLENFGAREVPREDFMKLLSESLTKEALF